MRNDQCFRCKHFTEDSLPLACAAFPKGIPVPILVAKADHTEPYEGDHGIQFEPREPTA